MLSRNKWIYLSFLLIFIVVTALVFYVYRSNQGAGVGYEIYESEYTLKSGYAFHNIQVRNMKDQELEKKVNESLNSHFYILIEPWFRKDRVRALEPIIHCQTEKYLSVEYIFEYTTAVNTYWRQCVTVDMQTGEVVFLDDLVDLNQNFAELIKTGTILKSDMNSVWVTSEEATKSHNDHIVEQETNHILKLFSYYTRQNLYGNYDKNNLPEDDWEFVNFKYGEFFYLEPGRIRFTTFMAETQIYDVSTTYMNLEDIEDYLKVPKW